jgi:predicted transcriptional regulator
VSGGLPVVTKDRLHELVEAVPEPDMATAARILEALARMAPGEPFYTTETAPLDDEPETDGERLAIARGEADLAAGRVVSAAELEQRFGL